MPTLRRTALAGALLAWLWLATQGGLSPFAVWGVVAVLLALVAGMEAWLRRRGSAPPRASRQAGAGPESAREPAPPGGTTPLRAEPPTSPPRLTPPGVASSLLQPFGPVHSASMKAVASRIDLPSSKGAESFGRLVPFGDGREVVVRRERAMGGHYGHEQGRRLVQIGGHELVIVRYQALLSPPALRPGEQPMSREAARAYQPQSEVLYLPDAELFIQREPRGFNDAEVEQILRAVSLIPSPAPAHFDPPASEALAEAVARLRARSASSFELKKAIHVLGDAGSASLAPLLRDYLRNTDLTVVEAACQSLARLGAREVTADLLDLLRPEAEVERNIDCSGDPFGWPEAPPRASALLALTALRVVGAEPAVRQLLSDTNREVQRLARNYFEVLGLNEER